MSDIPVLELPESLTGSPADRALAAGMIDAWRTHGIFYLATGPAEQEIVRAAMSESRRFFALPFAEKARYVNDTTYSGYIASGEEVTAGEADHSEIFTVCKDIAGDDERSLSAWPAHGPVPWPGQAYERAMKAFMTQLGSMGERLLALAALGLGLDDPSALNALTADGWHHMRVLRFPAASDAGERGIGAHTDYGLLVIAAQDSAGGLWIRPPVSGEHRNRNWLGHESTAGMFENDEPWTYVPPVPGTLTVFPGDILQLLTGGHLLSTPHKVRLAADRERYSMAYFHEPAFQSWVEPLRHAFPDGGGAGADPENRLHYGTHFTRMFLRCYPDRMTTLRLLATGGLERLARLRESALPVERMAGRR
ncbi:2-oxoglutarate and iron-dependent oxygenase domain-containing protein [Streptomyces jumonjinensis]|uniref:2-oxoglutarate and iron-dependent oxygenase domain-containing protein n=1 Tax=Streptomyces jumonjinensis TaxID=1945 RepID=UPI00379111D2